MRNQPKDKPTFPICVDAELTLETGGHQAVLESQGDTLVLKLENLRSLRAMMKGIGGAAGGAKRLLELDGFLKQAALQLAVQVHGVPLAKIGHNQPFTQIVLRRLATE